MLGNLKLANIVPVGEEAKMPGALDSGWWRLSARTPSSAVSGSASLKRLSPQRRLLRGYPQLRFDWNGKKEPLIFATENDGLNGVAMLFGKLVTNTASLFADVRTYWSPEAVERVTSKKLTGRAANGFIHLINSGSAALDATGMCKDENGNPVIKKWWEVTDEDIKNMLSVTDWCPADTGYFRGGGYSSHFRTRAEMPMTMIRVNLIDGLGPVLQVAEGYTVVLPDDVHRTLDKRTDPMAHNLVRPEPYRQGRIQDVLGNGKLGRKPALCPTDISAQT